MSQSHGKRKATQDSSQQRKRVVLTYAQNDNLCEKAKTFARGFEIDNFVASNGWINKFKQHHHLKEYVK
uniref:HTH CENPB-type domain-containing protein n=1 Tax=Rhizophagus irregularis (strain DAOM 181602 / DAOM 197198 / MUCL 43194) TaxID=747089 RepID=U9SVH5_RHIID